MKKKLVALILIGSMALSFTACGNSSDSSKGTKESSKKTEASAETPKEEAKEEVKDPVVLTGKWEYKDDDGTWMQADITEDTITINWIMDEGNTTAVYWVGTYTAPTEYSEEYTWTSTRDREATDSIPASNQTNPLRISAAPIDLHRFPVKNFSCSERSFHKAAVSKLKSFRHRGHSFPAKLHCRMQSISAA